MSYFVKFEGLVRNTRRTNERGHIYYIHRPLGTDPLPRTSTSDIRGKTEVWSRQDCPFR